MARALVRWAVLAAVFIWIEYAIALPRFWVYATIWLGAAIYGLLSVDPTLMPERRKPGGRTLDPWALLGIRVCAITATVVALVDIDRFHWSETVPPTIRGPAPAMVLYAAALLFAVQTMSRTGSSPSLFGFRPIAAIASFPPARTASSGIRATWA
jgi:hypothetical protein